MTFLNPFVLVGLAAASIPLILHLLNLRKLQTIEFSSIRFLQELQKTSIRKLKIRQWLLLVVRTLLIVALVFAFARPALTGSAAGIVGSRAATTMIVFIDDSPSMVVRGEHGELFTLARRVASSLFSLAHQGDHVSMIPLSALVGAHSELPPGTEFTSPEALDKLEVSHETAPYHEAILAAQKIAARTTNANQECYLITDGQATQFRLPEGADDTSRVPQNRLRVFVLEIPHQVPANMGIDEVTLRSQIIARGRPVTVRATVSNSGDAAVRNAVISGYLGGTRVAQQTVDVAARSTAGVDFTIIPKASGVLDAYIQLESDDFEDDNRRWFVLNVPDSINVLLLGAGTEDTRLASLALLPGGDPALAGLFRVRSAPETDLPSVDLTSVDVLALCNVHDISEIEGERISQFVRSGGGLAVFPGPKSDVASYNATLFRKLGLPPASPPSGAVMDSTAAGGSQLTFDRVDFAHPVFADLFEHQPGKKTTNPSVESPKIRRSVGISAGPRGRSIITLPGGRDFLDEYNAGAGRIFIFAVDAGLAWSDFAVKGIFAPLLHRTMIYLSAADKTFRSFTTGQEIEFLHRFRHMSDDMSFIVTGPSGVEERVAPRREMASGFAVFSTSNSAEPGVYALSTSHTGRNTANTRIAAAAVNIDPRESDLRIAGKDLLDEFRQRSGIEADRFRVLSSEAPVLRDIEESRFGVELWRYFLGLAILLALAEMLLARTRSHTTDPGAS